MEISGKNKNNNKKLSSEAVYWNNHFWAAEAEVTPVIREQPCYSSELSGLPGRAAAGTTTELALWLSVSQRPLTVGHQPTE